MLTRIVGHPHTSHLFQENETQCLMFPMSPIWGNPRRHWMGCFPKMGGVSLCGSKERHLGASLKRGMSLIEMVSEMVTTNKDSSQIEYLVAL